MNVPNHYPATKALSVYNVLCIGRSNALPLTHVLRVLQKHHLPKYDADDVAQGVQYLVKAGLAKTDGTILQAAHTRGPKAPVPLKRKDGSDDKELELDP